jgi:hypothetical protein
VSALTHRTAQFFEMTDPQIFAFLVMPFLFVLTCGMVFFSRERPKPEQPADPLEPVTRPKALTRERRKRGSAAKQANAAED